MSSKSLVDANDGPMVGGTSLRDAIVASNATLLEHNTITFDSSLADGTITLTLGELVIGAEFDDYRPGCGSVGGQWGQSQPRIQRC